MHARLFPSLLSLALLAVAVRGAETFDEAMARATVDYGARLRQASDELTQVRERIAREKAPLLKAMRAAEDRIIAAASAITRLDTAQEHSLEVQLPFLQMVLSRFTLVPLAVDIEERYAQWLQETALAGGTFTREQCRWLDHSLYHLDGTQALHQLPALLAIEELDAIEWTPQVR